MPKASHPILRTLGATIRSLRVQRKLSQEALADLAEIDRSYMSGIERGLRNISVLHACRIAKALEVSLADLLHLHADDARRIPTSQWMIADHDVRLVDELTERLGLRRPPASTRWEVGRYLSLG